MSADVKPFSCNLCREGFSIKTFLDIHMKDAHISNGTHGCSECCCVFDQADKLEEHQVKIHDYIKSLPKIIPRQKPKDKQTSLTCKYCDIPFHTAGFLKSHIQRKHPNASDSEEDEDDEDEEEEEEEESTPGLKYPRLGYNSKANTENQQNAANDKPDIFQSLTNGSKNATSLSSSKDNQESVHSGGEEKSNDSSDYRSSNFVRRSSRSIKKPRKGYGDDDDDDDEEEEEARFKPTSRRKPLGRLISDSDDDTTATKNANKTKDNKNSSSNNLGGDNDVDDDDYGGPNDDDFNTTENDYQHDTEQQEKDKENTASSLQMSSGFLIDDDMEADEAQTRRSNIDQLINSIPDDDDAGDNHEESTISPCSLCGTLYSDPQSLLNHKKTSHVKGGHYKCAQCPCVFATGPELIVHNGIFHGSAPTLLPPENSNDKTADIISCEDCGEDFSDPLQLTIHKVRNHGAFLSNSDLNGQSSVEPVMTQSHTYVTTSSYTSQPYQTTSPSYGRSEFYCDICQVDYKIRSVLNTHMRVCHVVGGMPCDLCPCVFSNKSSLKSHRKKHLREMGNSISLVPSQDTSMSNVYNTIGSDTMKIIPCKICDVNFLTMSDYLAHKETSHVASGRYPCSRCACIFDTFETLKTHRVVFHNNSESLPSSSSISITSVVQNMNNKKQQQQQQQKQNLYSSPKSSYSQAQSNAALAESAKYVAGGKIECPKCGVLLSSKGTLRNHLDKSHVLHGYKCKLCPCKFQGLAGVKSHLHSIHRGVVNVGEQYYHPGEEPADFEPNNIQYESSRYSSSATNNWNYQSGEKSSSYLEDEQYRCIECDWTLSDATDLQNHRIQFHGYKPDFGIATTFTPTAVDEIINNDDPYSCSACRLTFNRKSETLSHRKRNHVLGGKFRCQLNEHSTTCRGGKCICCKCVYSSAAALKAHEIGKHKGLFLKREREKKMQLKKRQEVRKPTPVSTPKATVSKPMVKQGNTEFVCVQCGRRYQLSASLQAHKNRSHKTKGVQCSHCTCIFTGQTDLDMHFKKYHRHVKFAQEPDTTPRKGRGRPRKNSAAPAVSRFTCQYAQCEMSCRNQSALTSHIKSKHLGPVEVVTLDIDDDVGSKVTPKTSRNAPPDYDILKLSMENPLMTPSGKYACRFCTTTFSRSSAMLAHIKTFHMEENKLVCFECIDSEESFSTMSELSAHRKYVHGIESFLDNSNGMERTPIITNCTSLLGADSGYEKPAVPRCEICYRTFTTSRSLWTHRKRSHVNGDFNCPEPDCTCGFGTSRGLRNHLLIFHGIRDDTLSSKKRSNDDEDSWLIDCWECEITFTSNRKLEAHKKRFHVPDGPYPCLELDCSCVFATSTAMNIHKMKMHGLELPPYIPPADDILLDEVDEPEIETSRTNSSSKTEHPCKQCGMVFSLPSALQSHMEQAHVKNGAHPCPECVCVFGTAHGLSSHKIAHNLRTKAHANKMSSDQDRLSSSPINSSESRKRGRPSSASKEAAEPPKVGVAKKKTGNPPPLKTDIVGMALAAAMGSAPAAPSTAKPTTSSGLCCSTCKKAGFPSASVLRRHEVQCKKRRAPAKTPLECKFCSRKFTLVASLQDHMKLKHAPDGKSDSASKAQVDMVDLDSDGGGDDDYFHDTSIASPPKEPTPPPPPPPKKRKTKFPCKECDIIFPKSRILKTHKLICHVKNGTLSCDAVKCSCKFNLPWALYFHKKHQHDPNRPLKTKKKKRKRKKKIIKENTENKENNDKSAETAVTKKKKKKISTKNKKRRLKVQKGFFSPRTLKNRERLITGIEKKHPCGVCAVKFRWPFQLARHERINHPGPPEYLCEKCPSMTALSKELRHHEEIYHSDYMNMHQVFATLKKRKLNNGTAAVSTTTQIPAPIPFPSNIQVPTPIIPTMQPTSFLDKSHHEMLMMMRPFKLDENVPLDLSNVIASYSMGGSGVLGGADITAGFSGQHALLMRNKLLRRKLRRKKGIHMCRICRMMFLSQKSLSSHLSIHVGEKPFKCRFCAVSFRTYGQYLFHKKKHIAKKSGEKEPVERKPLGRCSYCSATFRTKFLQDCHFDEVHPELKFLDMCEQASNLWKEVKSGDNISIVQ